MRSHYVLIVMTRLPREGRNKTRLIPALGPAGATAMHDRLARHAVGRASSYALTHPGTCLQIYLEGGTPSEGRGWLGDVECHVQSDGDLGQRMQAAVDRAFADGAGKVVVMGTDCPSVNEAILADAFHKLLKTDLVFGPAADGGYYLIGLARPSSRVFTNIEWGGPLVLKQSLFAAREEGFKSATLETLHDVDLPDDIPAAEAALASGETVSIIIPVFNEERDLPYLLDRLKRDHPHEIIVADGGSRDRTVEIAKQAGARVVDVAKGRASQMNLAAAAATGEFLLFLHADTLPPPDFQQVIRRVLRTPGTSAGAFRFALAGNPASAALIERLVNLRCRLFGTPYGDQGLFLRRSIFRHVGRFPDWPVMEDLHMVRLLKRVGRVRLADEPARTSARRWENGGAARTFLRHQLMLAAYHLGLPPRVIAKLRH